MMMWSLEVVSDLSQNRDPKRDHNFDRHPYNPLVVFMFFSIIPPYNPNINLILP